MTALVMALDKHIVDLLPDGNRSVLMRHDLSMSGDDQPEHLLSPKAELSSTLSSIVGFGKDGEDLVVHPLRHERLFSLARVETFHIVVEDSFDFSLCRESISAIPGIDRGRALLEDCSHAIAVQAIVSLC